MSVLIVTSLGDIVVDLYTEKCPLTCKNFLKLCKIKYYNGCLFHTVQKDFTAQTGDPTGTGTGGDSVYKFLYGDQARFFSDEIHLDLKHSKTGTVAMASAGENLNASQFYITLCDDLDYLDGKHTVFGEVAEGLETLTRINEAYVDDKNRPYKNIRIKHTYILDDPFDDPSQLADLIPDSSPEGKPKDEIDDEVRLEDDWVPMDEQLGVQELEEVLHTKEAHSRAVVLESIGDIPDAEIKPPDNVLFVCKLNPVTEDEDLHTIFSRFGTVVSAEVIRDYKTGDSLCYAFIEFETKESCEQAYFKMDNALIDDRRIHVDFSQSVAKLWSQYRRKDGQAGRGKGCFKCGSLDHKANDCTAGPTAKHNPKYILRDDNIQRGGDNNSRYDMVFDEDNPESPRREKKHRHHGTDEHVERRKTHRNSSEERERCHEKKDSRYPEEQADRGRHNDQRRKRDDDRRDRRETSKSHAHADGRKDKKDSGDYRSRSYDDNYEERREDVDGRKRSKDDDGHREDSKRDRDKRRGIDCGKGEIRSEASRRDYGDHKVRREERDHRSRASDYDSEHHRHRGHRDDRRT